MVRIEPAPQPRQLELGQVVLHGEHFGVQVRRLGVVLHRHCLPQRGTQLGEAVLRVASAQLGHAVAQCARCRVVLPAHGRGELALDLDDLLAQRGQVGLACKSGHRARRGLAQLLCGLVDRNTGVEQQAHRELPALPHERRAASVRRALMKPGDEELLKIGNEAEGRRRCRVGARQAGQARQASGQARQGQPGKASQARQAGR
mmetsp:Transcript_1723/g.4325  ORF Transcript_1723/g.4325 Transcript_1723/m.4325 type:complete len:203 (-) Transcript_1723:632-1240(-)